VERHAWDDRDRRPEYGSENGMSGSLPVEETPRLPLRDRPAELIPATAHSEATPRFEVPPRLEPASGFAATPGSADDAAPVSEPASNRGNLDGLTSRLDHLEDLLGRLVSEPPEPQPAAEIVPEQQAATQNGNGFVTLGELDEIRNQAETEAIVAALEKTEWNRKKAAKLLKTDYKALLYRMKKLGIGERNDDA
jgi:two-component system response regulator AtoC